MTIICVGVLFVERSRFTVTDIAVGLKLNDL